MKTSIKVISLLFLFTILISCNKTSTEPEPQAGRRDYLWNITEIKPGNEQLYLMRIWGVSPQKVWAVGSSSWPPTTIWYYNGSQWRCDSTAKSVQPTAIFGFSNNQVWLGNSNNTIWFYDGNQWKKFGEYKVDGYDYTNLNNFDGTSSIDIYGVGFADSYKIDKAKAIILRYDGAEWKFQNLPEIKVSFETVAIERSSNVLVMSGTVYERTGFIAKVYIWNGFELKELLSDYGWSFVTKLGDEIFATLASKIYKYSDKSLTLWKDNTGTGIDGNIICGRSRNDFFIGSIYGISHFNGENFTTVYKTDLTVERGIAFENEVFFIGQKHTTGKNYIIHGQLK